MKINFNKYKNIQLTKKVDKTFQYMDEELIQYIDAIDNIQTEYLQNWYRDPYKKAIKFYKGNKVKYIILKSRREGYEIRILKDKCKFKDELVKSVDIKDSRKITGIDELIYVDNNARLCCTETLESAMVN